MVLVGGVSLREHAAAASCHRAGETPIIPDNRRPPVLMVGGCVVENRPVKLVRRPSSL